MSASSPLSAPPAVPRDRWPGDARPAPPAKKRFARWFVTAVGPGEGEHDPLFLWTVTICLCVLATGWTAALRPAWNPGASLDFTRDDAPGGGLEATLEEAAAGTEETAFADSAEETPEAEAPPAEAEEPPPLPDPVEALTAEDIFEVPPAPLLETAARTAIPPQPKPEKPKPAPQTPKPAARPPQRPPAANPAPRGTGSPAATGAGAGNPGSGSGAGSGGGGPGKRRTPQPPYPSFARSGNMSGTVVVSISFSPSGEVASATLVRSCGHPELDSYTLNFIRNRWKWPGAHGRAYTQDIRYRLKR